MQSIATVLAVAVIFVVVNLITPAFSTVCWSTPVSMGWTIRVAYMEAAQFVSSLTRHDLL
jgi:hypothetical protein